MNENLPVPAEEKRHVALFPFADIERMAAAVAASGLFGVKTPAQALALMLVAQAEGKHPASAALEYDIIQGRPALKATAVQGRFQQAGGTVKWIESTDEHCIGEFFHPMGGTLKVEWTIQRAREAGLANKPTWKQYPRQMLRSRVVTEGVRAVYPACLTNSYSEDEVRDFIEVTAEVVATEPGKAAPSPAIEPEALTDTLARSIDGRQRRAAANVKIIEAFPGLAKTDAPAVYRRIFGTDDRATLLKMPDADYAQMVEDNLTAAVHEETQRLIELKKHLDGGKTDEPLGKLPDGHPSDSLPSDQEAGDREATPDPGRITRKEATNILNKKLAQAFGPSRIYEQDAAASHKRHVHKAVLGPNWQKPGEIPEEEYVEAILTRLDEAIAAEVADRDAAVEGIQ